MNSLCESAFHPDRHTRQTFSRASRYRVHTEKRPHLKNGIRESKLENSSGNRFERGFMSHLDVGPYLFAIGITQIFEHFRVFCREPRACLCAEDGDIPCVFFAGAILCVLMVIGNNVPVRLSRVSQRRVACPMFRRERRRLCHPVFRKLCPREPPAHSGESIPPERNMTGMHAEIAHAAVFAVQFNNAFPVDGFVRVKVARMEESGFDLDYLPESLFSQSSLRFLNRREKRKLR